MISTKPISHPIKDIEIKPATITTNHSTKYLTTLRPQIISTQSKFEPMIKIRKEMSMHLRNTSSVTDAITSGDNILLELMVPYII